MPGSRTWVRPRRVHRPSSVKPCRVSILSGGPKRIRDERSSIAIFRLYFGAVVKVMVSSPEVSVPGITASGAAGAQNAPMRLK